jgi:hypothetical protein
MRRSLMTFLVAVVAGAGALAAAPMAGAGIPSGVSVPGEYYYVTPCAGHVIKTYRLHNELDETRGLTQVYYSTSLGGVVCAMTLDSSRGSHGMTVTLRKHSLRATGSDRGSYAHYAGGIADPRAKGRCFTISGSVNYGSNRSLQFSGGGSFCNPQRL